jgi:hypothetical protein
VNDYGLRPEPPEWALAAGLPRPNGEGFTDYVSALGLDPRSLLDGLTEQTICIANLRLATTLQRAMPHVFDLYVDKLAEKHIEPERRKALADFAYSAFGSSYRRPARGVTLLP